MKFAVSDPRDIKRMSATPLDKEISEQRLSVLKDANELFGYNCEFFGGLGPLAQLLDKLGINPLNKVEVEAYKDSKEKSWITHHEEIGHVLITLLPFIPLAALWYFLPWDDKSSFSHAAGYVITQIVWGLVWIVGGNIWWDGAYKRLAPDFEYETKWISATLCKGGYTGYIPVFALDMANKIIKENGNCRLHVETLTITRRRYTKPLPDPFLRVSLDQEIYYIAVWDEREFEAKL